MNALKQILRERDGLSGVEADDILNDLGDLVFAGENPEELLMDELGLEPDYLFDLLEYAR